MEDDWDLHAVVRGCATTTTATSSTTTTVDGGKLFSQDPTFSSCSSSSFQDLFQPRTEHIIEDQLHNICKPFFPKPKLEPNLQTALLSPQRLPVITPSQDPPSSQMKQQFIKQIPHQQTRIQQKPQLFSVINGPKSSAPHHPTPKSKKRKNHLKRVCHVSAEGLSSDMWSWRKYGQKPIKGSPYPRGYYKCSTLAGCMARKQVERNRSDPGMFIVTYSAEHNHPMPAHRSTLAGNTRLKPNNSDQPKKPSSSSSPEMSPADSLSPLLEKVDDDDDDVSASEMALDDSFFAGLDDFTGQEGGECLADQFPASLQLPWLEGTAATTVSAAAAGGG